MGCDESKPCPAALVQTQVVSEMGLNSHSSEIMKEIGLILVVVGIVEIGRYLINKNKKCLEVVDATDSSVFSKCICVEKKYAFYSKYA